MKKICKAVFGKKNANTLQNADGMAYAYVDCIK